MKWIILFVQKAFWPFIVNARDLTLECNVDWKLRQPDLKDVNEIEFYATSSIVLQAL